MVKIHRKTMCIFYWPKQKLKESCIFQTYAIHLRVTEGLTLALFSVPHLVVMDGFGRLLTDQFYKIGSSLEVMCQVGRKVFLFLFLSLFFSIYLYLGGD